MFGLLMFICLVPSVVLLYVMMYPKNWQKKQRIFGVNNRPEFKVDKSAKFIDILVGTHKKQGTAILIGILVISTLLLFVPGLTIKMIVWTVFVYIALVVICIPYALGNSELKKYFKDTEYIFKTVIPRNIRLAEAPSYGKPCIVYDPESKGAVAYLKLAKELLKIDSEK